MIIDSHAHYSCEKFGGSFPCTCGEDTREILSDQTRNLLFSRMRADGITAAIEPAIGMETNEKLLVLCGEEPGFLYPAVGVHPTRTWQSPWKDRRKLDALAEDLRVVAIGETGLDYHYPRKDQHRIIQMAWFFYQIRLADRKKLPLILHIRQADRDALRILRANRKHLHGGVAHCFSGDIETARQYLALGFSIGIGGTLLQNHERAEVLKETVRLLPMDRILLETDAPYVSPDLGGLCSKKSGRKVRNSSLILPEILRTVAALKGCSREEAEQVIYENTCRVFKIHPGQPAPEVK